MSALSKLATYKPHRSLTDPTIRRLLGTHYDYFKKHEATQTFIIDHEKAAPFYYNLFAYLQEVGIPREVHYCVMLLSDITNPTHFNKDTVDLIIPDVVTVETIIAEAGI